MSPDDFRSALASLGLTQADFARLAGSSTRAVSAWLSGERALSGPLEAYVGLLLRLPPAVREAEYARAGLRPGFVEEGLYIGSYWTSEDYVGTAFLVLRNGVIFGADNGLSRIDGTYGPSADPEGGVAIAFRVEIRAGERSIVGDPQPFDWIIRLHGAWPNADLGAAAPLQTDRGDTVWASFRHLRPLPNPL